MKTNYKAQHRKKLRKLDEKNRKIFDLADFI